MRILQVMASCSRVSGVAQVMMNYYRHMSDRVAFDFLLFWKEENSFEEEIIKLGGKVFYTGKPSVRTVLDYIRTIDTFFSENKGIYDGVHLHELYMNSIIFPLAKKHGIRIRIAHSHTSKYSERRLNALRNRILYLPINKNATHYFACSKNAGIVAFGSKIVDNGNLYIVNNAIEVDKFLYLSQSRESIRKELGIEDNFVVGHIGRFSPLKNHRFLVNVFAEIHNRKPESKLLLVGDGVLKNQIARLVEQKRLQDSVVFLGQRNDIGALLSAMDCFVLPSLFEGLGIVLIEAQCNGLPCVASSTVPNEARILHTCETVSLDEGVDLWADSIVHNNRREEKAYEAVSKAGYNITVECPKLIDKYYSLVEGTK